MDQALESEASLHLSYALGLVDQFDDASEGNACVFCTLIPTTLYDILFKCAFFPPHSRLCFVTLTPVLYDLTRRDVFIAFQDA